MNLSTMSSADLRQLKQQVERELKQREGQDRAKARIDILAIAQSVGVPVQELIAAGTSTRAKTGPVAPRYRNPANAEQLWTGRGRQPKWVRDWLEAGKDIDGLKV